MPNRTAVRQALHFSLGLTFSHIARLEGLDPSTIRQTVMATKSTAWARRSPEERTEAIAAARALIEEGGR